MRTGCRLDRKLSWPVRMRSTLSRAESPRSSTRRLVAYCKLRANIQEEIGKVYAGRNGIIGALTEDLIDTSVESEAAIAALKHTPGAAFGSCRYKLTSIHEHRAQYDRLIEVFRAHDIGFFFYNGGGDFSGHRL